uniref:Putative secreted protein n=1 Tax=Lutzomyia longipalpis TaxID=7200 RepID=A0A1B0CD56_LUTLO
MEVLRITFLILGVVFLQQCRAEYYENDYYSEYECNWPLLEHAVLSATSALRERGPNNARLDGKCSQYSPPNFTSLSP